MEFKTNQNHFFLDYEYYLVAKKMLKVKDGIIFRVVSGQPLWHERLDNELFKTDFDPQPAGLVVRGDSHQEAIDYAFNQRLANGRKIPFRIERRTELGYYFRLVSRQDISVRPDKLISRNDEFLEMLIMLSLEDLQILDADGNGYTDRFIVPLFEKFYVDMAKQLRVEEKQLNRWLTITNNFRNFFKEV